MPSITSDKPILIVDGDQEIVRWTSVSIHRSLRSSADDFTFDYVPEGGENVTAFPSQLATECKIAVDGPTGREVLIEGYLERRRKQKRSDSRLLSLSGRSKTGRATEVTAQKLPALAVTSGNVIDNQPILDMANTIAGQIDLKVELDVLNLTPQKLSEIRRPIAKYKVKIGSTIHTALSDLASESGLVLTSDGTDTFLLTQGTSTNIRGPAEFPGLFESFDTAINEDVTSRFGTTLCIGQRRRSIPQVLPDDITRLNSSSAKAVDDIWPASHIKLIRSKHQGNVQQYLRTAEHSRARSIGDGFEVTMNFVGWRDATRQVWAPNTAYRVVDAEDGLDELMIVAEVSLTMDEGEQTSTVTFIRPESLQNLDPPKRNRRTSSRRSESQRRADQAAELRALQLKTRIQ